MQIAPTRPSSPQAASPSAQGPPRNGAENAIASGRTTQRQPETESLASGRGAGGREAFRVSNIAPRMEAWEKVWSVNTHSELTLLSPKYLDWPATICSRSQRYSQRLWKSAQGHPTLPPAEHCETAEIRAAQRSQTRRTRRK